MEQENWTYPTEGVNLFPYLVIYSVEMQQGKMKLDKKVVKTVELHCWGQEDCSGQQHCLKLLIYEHFSVLKPVSLFDVVNVVETTCCLLA